MLSGITPTPASMCACCHTQEWPPQYERDPRVDFHVENDKINGDKRNSVFSPEYPWRSPQHDELIGLLAANTCQQEQAHDG